jgi:hypothetical protein
MEWAGHGVRVEGKGGDYRVLVEIPKGKRPYGTERVILKQIFKKWDWRAGIGLILLRIEKGCGNF